MKNNRLLILLLFIGWLQHGSAQYGDKNLFFISNSHLDTQWNWDVKTTINEYIPKTMIENFALFDKYPDFQFNFEAAIHYMWMKEYYPSEYERLKEYIKEGRWNISGGSVNANDVMVPSAESIIRNFLYGQTYFKQEFGRKGGSDIMLPDCFGFPYSLPTLGKHCGVTGFHTAKLSWGSAYDYNSLAPFGIWKGVDGSEIYAIFKGEAYDEHEKYNKDMSNDSDILNIINSHESQYGVAAAFRYVGPRSDRGGALKDNPTEKDENTPFWLQESVNSNGPVTVKLATPNEIFEYLDRNRNENYFVWDNELPMSLHGTGCYTSQAIMKYWNRKNELLADATEKSSVFGTWLGGIDYPSDIIRDSWIRLIWHQFHDDLTGTSIPNAYNFSYNDELLVNSNLSKTLTNSVGSIVRQMDTQVEGIPIVVYNPLSIQRTDIVEGSVIVESAPSQISIMDMNGNSVLAQVLSYDSETKNLSFIFQATVPSLGYAVYDLSVNDTSTSENSGSLVVTNNTLENGVYKISLNSNGDVVSIQDKAQGIELLTMPIRLGLFNDRSTGFPSWEIQWGDVNSGPIAYVDENVEISIAEEGPLRASLKVARIKNGSEFVQYIQLPHESVSERIDFVNEVNWQNRGTMLKAIFPLRAENPKATYDLSIGAIERVQNASNLYEVAGHQWADQTSRDDSYGVSILNDCKYGWDKPNNSTLRLTLIHTPSVDTNYVYQKDQDLGLNHFTYSFYRHLGKWNEDTQWEAARLNQPLLAFQAPKHEGVLGKNVEFVNVNTSKVAIKALKKAEESVEIIVRVYELTGENQADVEVNFPVNIISARELNGIEEEIGIASYTDNVLSFDIGRFQPKTFAIKLDNYTDELAFATPSSTPVDLSYNIDVMSYDDNRNNATSEVKYAYPAELLPEEDILIADGIEFKIGSRRNGSRNAVYCNAQTIDLTSGENIRKIYILAASSKEEGSVAEFLVDGTPYTFSVPYYAGYMGSWETDYNLGSEFRRDNIAFTATHRHNVSDNKDDHYNFMYMYKYCIPVEGNVSTLTLPTDRNLYVFAVTLSDNENDDITPVSELTAFPMSDNNSRIGECVTKLTPKSVSASHQNGNNEGPEKAIDGDLNTKWCVTNNNTPWLEFTFEESVEICRWFVINAGTEDFNSITSAFRLQKYDEGKWVDVDVVQNNTINKVSRSVEPFMARRIRLQIDKGGQKDNTTRILEFAVYGDSSTGVSQIENSDKTDFYIKGNYPNPFTTTTVIQCVVPENITELNLIVYDLSGKQIDSCHYPLLATSDLQEIEWENSSLENGMYLYTVSALENGRLVYSDTGKMIIGK